MKPYIKNRGCQSLEKNDTKSNWLLKNCDPTNILASVL